MTMDRANVYAMASGNSVKLRAQDPASRRFAIAASALTQGRVLMDTLQMFIRLARKGWTTSLGTTMDFASMALSWPCNVEDVGTAHIRTAGIAAGDSDEDEAGAGTADLAGSLLCPLKFGAQGVDAIRASFTNSLAEVLPAASGLPAAG